MKSTSININTYTSQGEGPEAMAKPIQPSSMQMALRCHARTRQGKSCGSPAVKGKTVCRMHGGGKGSGAPKGEANGMWKHGGDTKEAVALRRQASRLLRMMGPSAAMTASNLGAKI